MLVVPVVRGAGHGLPEGITWKFFLLTHVCSPGTIQKLRMRREEDFDPIDSHVTFK